jgi:putative OPT family oligopeptide transporter
MAIATLLIATFCLKATGDNQAHGMQGAIAIGSIICIIAAMAGDTSQDLKTGYILGATPKKQQIGELIGAVVSAFTIGGVLLLLDSAWQFGSEQIPAPQATLMKMIIEGVMDGNLPWALVFIGVFIAVVIEILGISVLPVAIGLYLPLELSSTIMIGGIIRWFVDKKNTDKAKNEDASSGILFCSGMIAGEGLVGILLAIFAVVGIDSVIDFSGVVSTGTIGGVVLMIVMILCVLKFAGAGKADGAKK